MSDHNETRGTMSDLAAIEARSAASVEAEGTRDWHAAIGATADDVPALVAEVRSLREQVERVEALRDKWFDRACELRTSDMRDTMSTAYAYRWLDAAIRGDE